MALTGPELKSALTALRNARAAERARLERISRYWHDNVTGRMAGIYIPRRATAEYKLVVEQARFNILDIVVTAVAQNLFVDGYRPAGKSGRPAGQDNADIWEVWQANRMDARQAGIFRTAIGYGISYATVLTGDFLPVITPNSPKQMTVLYEDPMNDEWPELALRVERTRLDDRGRKFDVLELYDETTVYELEVDTESGDPKVTKAEDHGLGVTPVVRFLDRYDLEGSPGKVEPLISVQQQINQTTFGLLMSQQFSAFRQRWVTGMEIQKDAEGNEIAPFNAAVDTLFQAVSVDTKFGEFGQTDLKGYLDSRASLLLHVASVAQIPPHNLLTGPGISNISAEALAALEAGHRQDIEEHQTSFGESIEQMLRLAGRANDDDAAWADMSAQVKWRDTTPRSLSQVADALGKLASQLGIPARALWERIPGVTDQDLAHWEAMAAEDDLLASLESIMQEGEQDAQPSGQNGDAPAEAATGSDI